MKVDVWTILILIIICQGLFLISTILLAPERRAKRENVFLLIMMATFIWYQLEFLFIRNVIGIDFHFFYGTRFGSWFLIGPITYFYFKSIVDSNWRFSKVSLIHFLPFLLFFLIIPFLSSGSLSPRQISYGMLSVFDFREKTVTPFEYFYSWIFFLQFVHFGLYLLYNLHLVKSYAKNLKMEYSNVNQVIWLWITNVLLILILICTSIYLYLLFVTDLYRRHLDYIYALPMGAFIYSMGYYLSGINWLKVKPMETKYLKSSLKLKEKQLYVDRLKELMAHKKPYLQNELRLKQLAEMMGISNHHLSQIINEQFNCSFFDYINQHRINTAKDLILAKSELNLLQIAFASGFNNKTSFVNAFKKFEGVPPSTFRKKSFS